MKRIDNVGGEKADGYSGWRTNGDAKKYKRRLERRRAKQNPECLPHYQRYRGWVL